MIVSMPNARTHIFVPDLHGHLDMAERILATSGAATIDVLGHVIHIKEDVRLTFLGDLADRGDDSLGTLCLVRRLQGEGATVLAGNHEAAMHAAMRTRSPRNVGEWCAMGGTRVLKEMATYRHLLRSVSTPGNEPVPGTDAYLRNTPRSKPLDWQTLLDEADAQQIDCGKAMAAMAHFYEARVRDSSNAQKS